MGGERKPVMIRYRRFQPIKGINSSLEALVREAMETPVVGGHDVRIRDRYLERLYTSGSDNYFVNLYEDKLPEGDGASLIFGDVLHFTSGHLQALCQTADTNVSTVPVSQMKAPAQSEYVHSQMFWMLCGDHAFVVQSMSLRAEHFEDYLSWLLSNKVKLINSGSSVILNSKFDEAKVGGDLGDIQEIIVGGVVAHPQKEGGARKQDLGEGGVQEVIHEVVQHQGIDTGRTTGWDTAQKILKELLGGDANVERLMAFVPADTELNVQVHIGYKTKKRKVDRVALRQLESGLRNLPDSQLQVKAKGGYISTDGAVRLQHSANVLLLKVRDGNNDVIGTLLDPADVLRAMREAYKIMISNGKIDA